MKKRTVIHRVYCKDCLNFKPRTRKCKVTKELVEYNPIDGPIVSILEPLCVIKNGNFDCPDYEGGRVEIPPTRLQKIWKMCVKPFLLFFACFLIGCGFKSGPEVGHCYEFRFKPGNPYYEEITREIKVVDIKGEYFQYVRLDSGRLDSDDDRHFNRYYREICCNEKLDGGGEQ